MTVEALGQMITFKKISKDSSLHYQFDATGIHGEFLMDDKNTLHIMKLEGRNSGKEKAVPELCFVIDSYLKKEGYPDNYIFLQS